MSTPVNIHEMPFVRLLIPFAGGIALQLYLRILPDTPLAALAAIPLFGLLLIVSLTVKRREYQWLHGLTLNAFLAFVGLALAVNTSADPELLPNTPTQAIVRLADSPQQRARSLRVKGNIIEVIQNQQVRSSGEKILLYFELSDTGTGSLRYGDIVALTLTPREFEQPKNPDQFDMAEYMRRDEIRYSSFVRNGEWVRLKNTANPLIGYSLRLRDSLIATFRQCHIAGTQLAVLSALTLGYRELLDDEINRVYSSTGAVHILSVSGLHVGILYVFLTFLLGAIPSNRATRLLKLVTVLLFLWFFAILTGLSPSVNRSALMFSLVAIGKWYGIRANIYNTLAIAAFALLATNPYNLLNTGFQLSFLAVLSIVVFYPFIHPLLYLRNRILVYVWSLVAVSVAAQIGTLPITLGQFAQFPNYFILTNIIAIPLSTLILYMAVLLLAVSPFQAVALWVGKLLNFLLIALNSGLSRIESLPFSIAYGLHLSPAQMLVCMLGLIFVAAYLLRSRLKYMQAALLAFTGLAVLSIPQKGKLFDNEFVAFSLPKSSVLCFRVGGVAHFVDLNDTTSAVERHNFYLGGYIKNSTFRGRYHTIGSAGTHDPVVVRKIHGLAIVGAGQFTVAVPYHRSAANIQSQGAIGVNAVVVNGHFSPGVLRYIKPQVAIVENSVPKRNLDRILVALSSENIPVHYLKHKGAYTQPLQ